jgi:hypothetical protein
MGVGSLKRCPITVAHSEFLVRDNPRVAVVQQDATQVDQLLA